MQAFLDSGKAHAPFRPLPDAPPGVALSLPDALRVRDRSTIMARQMFAEQGAAYADEQVARLLASLGIDPAQLPAAVPGQAADWDRIFGAAAGPRLAQPSAAGEHAAAAAMAAQQQQWASEFERLRLGEAAPAAGGPSAWAGEVEQQQQQQPQQTAAPPAGWADEFAGAQGEGSSAWVNEFRSAAEAGSAMRQRAGGDALEQTRKLADTLAGGWRVVWRVF
jgi:peroxin-5